MPSLRGMEVPRCLPQSCLLYTSQRDSSFQNEHILFDSGVGKQALVEEQLVPDIKGVAVVCSGGDDIAVIERITELVSVVLDLPSNRICVTKKI